MAEATQPQHTEVGQGAVGHASFPPFDPSTFASQVVWFFVAFGLLYWFMSKRALPQIGQVIEIRRARIARDLDDATLKQQEADAAAAAHEKMLAEARAKAQATAQAARDQVQTESEAKKRALEDELAAKLEDAEKRIAATRAQAMSNVSQIAREATAAIVERLSGRPADANAISVAVEQART